MVFYKHVFTPMQTLQSKKIWYLSPSVQISKLLPPFFLNVNHSNWQSDIWINTTNFLWSWFWFNFHLFIWELKTVTFLHGKENYLFVNQGACGKKNFMAKSLQSLFFYNCQILSIVQYLVVSLSQNGCIILILSIYLSQVSCLYFKYHRLLNSGCSFSGDLSLHAS